MSDAALRRIAFLMVCLFAIGNTWMTQFLYGFASPVTQEEYREILEMAEKLPAIEDEYRYRNYCNALIMCSENRNTTGLRTYASFSSNALYEMDHLLNPEEVSHLRFDKNSVAGLAELCGGRYYLPGPDFLQEYIAQYSDYVFRSGEFSKMISTKNAEYEIRIHPACPMGFIVHDYISEKDIYSLKTEQRGIALLLAAAVPTEDIGERLGLHPVHAEDVISSIQKYPAYTEGKALFANPVIRELADRHAEERVVAFSKDAKGFSCEVDMMEDGAVFFSIPADEGWTVSVDGKDTEFVRSAGMILLPVQAGRHMVKAVYHTPGLKEGLLISGISVLVFLFLCWKGKKAVT